MPPIDQKPSFIVSLDVSLRLLPYETLCVVKSVAFCRQQIIFLLPHFLLPSPHKSCYPCKMSKLTLNLLRFQFWSIFFWFLIFILGFFLSNFEFFFNYIIQPQFVMYYFIFFNVVFILFIFLFLDSFVKLIPLFNFTFYFNLNPHSFFIFFLLLIWFFLFNFTLP